MILKTTDNNEIEIRYSDGYFILRKFTFKTDTDESSEVLNNNPTKSSWKTYANATGLVWRLKEWMCDVEGLDTLIKNLKLESSIEKAKVGSRIKDSRG